MALAVASSTSIAGSISSRSNPSHQQSKAVGSIPSFINGWKFFSEMLLGEAIKCRAEAEQFDCTSRSYHGRSCYRSGRESGGGGL
ncbi:hypothetical protein F0562_032079 [Nyssa sinensis]|uniref:Uncharacterized protein n=1 Tax=Nyssa sinensis TaxID=561372 RepID=A0A5J5AXR0_9ASTE|nr:hypothetical protein F0562_032079 [Nyssa sinensis]